MRQMTETDGAASGRRGFFRWLVRQGLITFEEIRGHPQMALSEIPQLSTGDFQSLIPALVQGVKIIPCPDEVQAQVREDADAVHLFPVQSLELAIFNEFNGEDSIAQVVESVAKESSIPTEEVEPRVSKLFLTMVALGVCAPIAAPASLAELNEQRPMRESNGASAEGA